MLYWYILQVPLINDILFNVSTCFSGQIYYITLCLRRSYCHMSQRKKTTNPLAVQLPVFKTNLWSCTMEQRDQWNCCFQYKLKWTGENILLKGDLLRFALFSALLQWWMLVLNMAKILNYGLKAQDSVFAYLGYLWFHWGSRDIPNMILSGTQLYLDPSIFLCGAWSLSCSFGGRSQC